MTSINPNPPPRPGLRPRPQRQPGELVTPSQAVGNLSAGPNLAPSRNSRSETLRSNMLAIFDQMSNAVAGGQRESILTPEFQQALAANQFAGSQLGVDDLTGDFGFSPQAPIIPTDQAVKALTRADLTSITGANGRTGRLQTVAASAWEAMKEAAASEGISLSFTGAWRSWDLQRRAWENFRATGENLAGNKVPNIAHPNNSLHPKGLAVDISLSKGAHEWLVANAAQFGWGPISSEPWHWEYRGGRGIS